MKPLARIAALIALFVATVVTPTQAGTTGNVSGFVRTEDGRPLARTEVRLQSPTQMLFTRTDDRGFFAFTAVDPNRVTMSIERPGYNPSAFIDYVSADANIRWTVALHRCFDCHIPIGSPRGPMQNPFDVYTFDAAALKEFFP